MTKNSVLTRAHRAWATTLALVVVGIACSLQGAQAGCGQYGPAKKLVDSLSPAALGAPRFDTRLLNQDDDSSDGGSTRSRPHRLSSAFKYLNKGKHCPGDSNDGASAR